MQQSTVPRQNPRPFSIESLRRRTSSGFFVPPIDGLRFVAISFVFIYHVAGDVLRHSSPAQIDSYRSSILFTISQHLNVGVPLFFVISGMILGLPFARHGLQAGPTVSLRKYFLRRITRLEPPYVLALLVFFALKLIGHRGTAAELSPHLAASLAYLHNIIYGAPSTINFVAWSLEVEVQFYILAPLLATVFLVRHTSVRRLILAAAILCTTVFAALHPDPWAQLSLAGNLQFFLTGFVLAELFLLRPPAHLRSSSMDVLAAAGWTALLVLICRETPLAALLLPAVILATYIGVFYGRWSARLFSNPLLTAIGGMCYTIYLFHNYVVAVVGVGSERIGQSFPFAARLALQMAITSPVVLAVSVLYYKTIEQPCMQPDWPSRLAAALKRMTSGQTSPLHPSIIEIDAVPADPE